MGPSVPRRGLEFVTARRDVAVGPSVPDGVQGFFDMDSLVTMTCENGWRRACVKCVGGEGGFSFMLVRRFDQTSWTWRSRFRLPAISLISFNQPFSTTLAGTASLPFTRVFPWLHWGLLQPHLSFQWSPMPPLVSSSLSKLHLFRC